ncbi:MAG: flagellar biosynthetic protein FliR [Roseinatronobacter sp.]
MTPELAALLNMLLPEAQIAFAVFLRVGAMMALAPAFGETVIPARVRLAVTLAFTLIVTSALPPAPSPTFGLPEVAAEVVAGLTLGIGLRLLVIALQVAGTIAAQSTSLAQFFGGAGVDPQPAMSQLLVMAGLALAVMLGLHVQLVELLLLSYDLFPVGALPDAAQLAEWGIAQTARAFALAFSLAMPFVLISVVYFIALGVINKAMPQLMVALVGAPAITFAGLALLMVCAPLMLPIWHNSLTAFLNHPDGLLP